MPSVTKLLEGFDFYKGLSIGDWELVEIFAEEISVIEYEEYDYTIALSFELDENTKFTQETEKELINTIKRIIKKDKIIESDYGNPYECYLKIKNTGNYRKNKKQRILIRLTGKSKRIYY